MNLLRLVLLIQSWALIVQAQDAMAIVLSLPQCAQTCLFSVVTNSSCQLTDTACICTNAPLQQDIQTCVKKTCTVRQGLTTQNASYTLCHIPPRNRAKSLSITSITMTSITNFVVVTRYIHKGFFTSTGYGYDDLALLMVQASGIPATVIIETVMIPNGFGRDIWTVPIDNITKFLRYLYITEVLYFVQVASVKLALLFFFLRLFNHETVRHVFCITIAFTLIWGFVFTVVGIFQCHPVSFWTSWDGQHVGKCVNINAFVWANAGISITLDFWMLAIPLREAARLNLTVQGKIGVCIMFSVGIFITIVSMIRLSSLVQFAKSENPTWDQVGVVRWSLIETNVGGICVCLPTLRMILVRAFPGVFRSSKRDQVIPTIGRQKQNQGNELDSGGTVMSAGTELGREEEGGPYVPLGDELELQRVKSKLL